MGTLLALTLPLLTFSSHAPALIMVVQGDEPVENLGWPEGVGTWGGSMNCKPDRTFTFENVPAGNYVLVTNTPKSKNSHPATPETVIVEAGQTTTVTLFP